MNLLPPLGLLLALLGSACFYLSLPRQCLLARPWPARRARPLGAQLWGGGLACFTVALQPLAAVFAFFTALMLTLVLLPYAAALLTLLRGKPR